MESTISYGYFYASARIQTGINCSENKSTSARRLPPEQAKSLWDRFESARIPKHGSWLNMAEIEINVMLSQCLGRRIDNIETVRSEVAAWQSRRDNLQAKVNWQFTTKDARIRLKRLHPTTSS